MVNVPRTIFQIFIPKPHEFRKFRNTKKCKNPIFLVWIFKIALRASSTIDGHILLWKWEKSIERFVVQVQRRNDKWILASFFTLGESNFRGWQFLWIVHCKHVLYNVRAKFGAPSWIGSCTFDWRRQNLIPAFWTFWDERNWEELKSPGAKNYKPRRCCWF